MQAPILREPRALHDRDDNVRQLPMPADEHTGVALMEANLLQLRLDQVAAVRWGGQDMLHAVRIVVDQQQLTKVREQLSKIALVAVPLGPDRAPHGKKLAEPGRGARVGPVFGNGECGAAGEVERPPQDDAQDK